MQTQRNRPSRGHQEVPRNRRRRHRQENGPQGNPNVKGEHSLSFDVIYIWKKKSACACLIIERAFFDVVYSLLCCDTVTQRSVATFEKFMKDIRLDVKGELEINAVVNVPCLFCFIMKTFRFAETATRESGEHVGSFQKTEKVLYSIRIRRSDGSRRIRSCRWWTSRRSSQKTRISTNPSSWSLPFEQCTYQLYNHNFVYKSACTNGNSRAA